MVYCEQSHTLCIEYMTRPEHLSARIFLDGSDLSETQAMKDLLGFVDGQTTNPSNFVKALKKERGEEELQFEKQVLLDLYKKRVQEISAQVPESVSVEVYADKNSTAEDLIEQGRMMYEWIPNAHIKLPIIPAGLEAAEVLVGEGLRVNMTLCFNQEQAAAVYAATKGAKKGDVYISPFIGRVSDKGQNGMNIVANIARMYKKQGDGHVEILAASIRTGEQLAEAISVGANITTSYWKAIKEWGESDMAIPEAGSVTHEDLSPIPFEELSLEKDWREYDISHPMTDDGLRRFAEDWNALIK